MDYQNMIVARIKAAREELGWSQAELSRQMGQASNTIQKVESGFIKNPEKFLPTIAEVTKKPLSYFFGEDNPELTEYANKARKFDMMMEMIQSAGFLNNNAPTNNGGERNVTVGGNGNHVHVGSDATKIIKEIMQKDEEERNLLMKVVDLEKEERQKLFELYGVLKGKPSIDQDNS